MGDSTPSYDRADKTCDGGTEFTVTVRVFHTITGRLKLICIVNHHRLWVRSLVTCQLIMIMIMLQITDFAQEEITINYIST